MCDSSGSGSSRATTGPAVSCTADGNKINAACRQLVIFRRAYLCHLPRAAVSHPCTTPPLFFFARSTPACSPGRHAAIISDRLQFIHISCDATVDARSGGLGNSDASAASASPRSENTRSALHFAVLPTLRSDHK